MTVTLSDADFNLAAGAVKAYGLENAMGMLERSTMWNDEKLAEFQDEWSKRLSRTRDGYPPKIIAISKDPWYGGSLPGDVFWPKLREHLASLPHLDEASVDLIDQASDKIVSYTPDPHKREWQCKGLVVGHVQSGKTTNFTAVIAKAVDRGYNLVIVFSGVHEGLRRQTQERLEAQLCDLDRGRWITLTTPEEDFQVQPTTFESLVPSADSNKAVLCVVKKNAAVLRKLRRWLKRAGENGGLRNVRALIIDDEADQASVQTRTINPLIRDLLNTLPRCTYLGYTATPFANVLIDPATPDDLYPRDFILNLPEPQNGYFGPRQLFGRDDLLEDGGEPGDDGYDMIRTVPDAWVPRLRPTRGQPFETPPIEDSPVASAVNWFWLATAARRARGDHGHSTMLIHTAMKTDVHQAYHYPLASYRTLSLNSLAQADEEFITALHEQWNSETQSVPSMDFGLSPIDFNSVIEHVPAVIRDTTIVLDNSRSDDRLNYGNGAVTAIVIGGNTLSRGLTLEGLVVSFFIRAARAYDTLLQMGRWFGYRPDYEDLPRIYMTEELQTWFRHLATVEAEIRLDIDRYEQQDLSPIEYGVRIRTHPGLMVTAKLGAARLASASYGGRRVQVRYFKHKDADWLAANKEAADSLITELDVLGLASDSPVDGAVVWRDVPVERVYEFLDRYEVHEESPDLRRDLLIAYIRRQAEDRGELTRWSVAVMAAADTDRGTVRLGNRTFNRIVRAPLADGVADVADIKTLMSKDHRVVDMIRNGQLTAAQARRMKESDLVDLRNQDIVHKHRGLLLLYPIDPGSPSDRRTRQQMDADDDVIGLALVFPGDPSSDHISVDLSGLQVDEGEDPPSDEEIAALLGEDSGNQTG